MPNGDADTLFDDPLLPDDPGEGEDAPEREETREQGELLRDQARRYPD
jgi:hypothetical protein